jgi:hypothetical protein
MRRIVLVFAGIGMIVVAAALSHVVLRGLAASEGPAGTWAQTTCSACHRS